MSNKQETVALLQELKDALNELGKAIRKAINKLENAVDETPVKAADDDPPGGNNPGAPDIP